MSEERLRQLSEQIAELRRQQQAASAPAAPAVVQSAPAYPPPVQPQYGPPPIPVGQQPQAIGVHVPVTLHLPDGREVSVRVEFGPEWASPSGMQALAGWLPHIFGWVLQARQPRGYGGRYDNNGYSRGGGYRR
jgi:hypothetical protein